MKLSDSQFVQLEEIEFEILDVTEDAFGRLGYSFFRQSRKRVIDFLDRTAETRICHQ